MSFIQRCPLYRGVLHTYMYVSFIQSILYQRCPLSEVPLCINPLTHVFGMHCTLYMYILDLYTIAFSGPEPIPPAAFNPDQCHQELVEYYHCHMRPPGEPILIPVVRNTNTVSQEQCRSGYFQYPQLLTFDKMM